MPFEAVVTKGPNLVVSFGCPTFERIIIALNPYRDGREDFADCAIIPDDTTTYFLHP